MQATAYPAVGKPVLSILDGDGLVTAGPERLAVTMTERLLIRRVRMVFDHCLACCINARHHSQTI